MLQRIDDAKLTAGQSDGLVPVFRIMRIPERLSQVFDRYLHTYLTALPMQKLMPAVRSTFQTGMG